VSGHVRFLSSSRQVAETWAFAGLQEPFGGADFWFALAVSQPKAADLPGEVCAAFDVILQKNVSRETISETQESATWRE